ncbi:Hypothetical protein MVR_LOCUS360 [uncultured virus]|nr:Hypothetical protein MVR_LOCUS360 [uncultured virus]
MASIDCDLLNMSLPLQYFLYDLRMRDDLTWSLELLVISNPLEIKNARMIGIADDELEVELDDDSTCNDEADVTMLVLV